MEDEERHISPSLEQLVQFLIDLPHHEGDVDDIMPSGEESSINTSSSHHGISHQEFDLIINVILFLS